MGNKKISQMDEIQSIDGSGNEYLYMVNGNTYGKVSMETLKRDVIDPSVASCSRNIPLWHKYIDMTDFFIVKDATPLLPHLMEYSPQTIHPQTIPTHGR